MVPDGELTVIENFKNSLTEFITKPLLEKLDWEPDFNPWNGIKGQKIFSYISGGNSLAYVFTGGKINPLGALSKNLFMRYSSIAGGFILGNIFREYYDHSGKHLKYNFRTGELMSQSFLFY